jgi:hypothetical protein
MNALSPAEREHRYDLTLWAKIVFEFHSRPRVWTSSAWRSVGEAGSYLEAIKDKG